VRLLVDTNRFAQLIANDQQAHERLQQASDIWLSVITIGELLAGFAQGTRRQANEQRLSELLQQQGVGVLLLDSETPQFYATTWQLLRRQGTRIPTNDLWIAAQALQYDLSLDTDDRHFQYVPGLKIIGSET
jgi:tRNA(fMet)-specific endonuclease VapC